MFINIINKILSKLHVKLSNHIYLDNYLFCGYLFMWSKQVTGAMYTEGIRCEFHWAVHYPSSISTSTAVYTCVCLDQRRRVHLVSYDIWHQEKLG